MPALTMTTLDPAALRAAMRARGISQRDLARRAGLAERTIVRAVRGVSVTERTFAKIASALDAIPEISSDLRAKLAGRSASDQ